MVTVAMVYNPVPEAKDRRANFEGQTPRYNVRYVAGLDGSRPWVNPFATRRRRSGWPRTKAATWNQTARIPALSTGLLFR